MTPTYGGVATTPYLNSCIELSEHLTANNIDHAWTTGVNESLVHRGRMQMMAAAIETGFEYFMWIDADIQFTPEDVGKLWNLITDPENDYGIVVGVYPMKKPGQSWYAAWVNGELVKDLDRFDKPIEVDFAGTGFMMISYPAIKKVRGYLQERYDIAKKLVSDLGDLPPSKKKVADEMLSNMQPDFIGQINGERGRIPALFMTPIHNDVLESEDYNFCRVARDAGLKVIMDPSVKLTHWGQWGYGAYEKVKWDDA